MATLEDSIRSFLQEQLDEANLAPNAGPKETLKKLPNSEDTDDLGGPAEHPFGDSGKLAAGKGAKKQPYPGGKPPVGQEPSKGVLAKEETEEDEVTDEIDEELEIDNKPEIVLDESITKEHMKAFSSLFEGKDLSEDFKTSLMTIFEAAVADTLNDYKTRLDEAAAEEAAEIIAEKMEELTEQTNKYVTYVAEEYVKENQLAIDSGLKGELHESFIAGLKNLFEEHYIDVPEDKVDVLEQMAEEVETYKNRVNEGIEEAIALKEENDRLLRTITLYESSVGLTEVQKEKLRSLSEGVEFETKESFAKKLGDLKEAYFTNNGNNSEKTNVPTKKDLLSLNESVEDLNEVENRNVDKDGKTGDPLIDITLAYMGGRKNR